MAEFTLQDLTRILVGSSGDVEGVDWDSPEILDTPFDELGYDSLALLETTARVRVEYGAVVPDDALPELKTPRIAVDFINRTIAQAA